MSEQTRVLYVQGGRVNVRSAPRIAPDNFVDALSHGDPVVVLADRVEMTPDGWLWRRLAGEPECWVAERNQQTDQVLMADAPPDLDDFSSQRLFVLSEELGIFSDPDRPAESVAAVPQGGEMVVVSSLRRVAADGWVWRQVEGAGEAALWAAEYNARTLERKLSRKPPAGKVQGRVQVQGQQFLLDGRPFKFVGANLREFPFYGRADVLPFTQEGHQTQQLQAMQAMGMRVVRMHACHKHVSTADARSLLGRALDRIHAHGLLAIVVLNDALGEFWVPGDERFHRHVLGHLDKHEYFHQGGYHENYLPFVREVVSSYADHPAIFAWELGNEYAIHPQPATPEDGEAFYRFVETVSGVIRSLDSNHLITTGLVNTGHVAPNDRSGLNRLEYGKRLYGLPTVDFLTVHFYEGNGEEQNSLLDLEIARQVEKPIIVEEWGATGGNRAELTSQRIAFWMERGASGWLQWGLSATQFNIGVGDNTFGMDPYADGNKDHYHALVGVYTDWAARLAG